MQHAGPTRGSRLDGRTLPELAALAAGCELCRLCDSRRTAVFGAGAPDAELMFVAESPGYHDDRSGRPFSGEVGELFDGLLADIGRSRDDVYVTTVVKCRPPRNRNPFPDEIEQCEGYLFHEVMLVRPAVICAMGNTAIRLLTGKPHRLSEVHGEPIVVRMHGAPLVVLPLYHPGAAVHAPRLVRELRSDMRRISALLRGDLGPAEPATTAAVAEPAPPPPPPPAPVSDDATQLSLEFGG